MTKEKAIKSLLKIPVSLGYLDDYSEGRKDANEQAEKIINKIYNDFESRVCGSCKYFHTDGTGYPDHNWCDNDISMTDDFTYLEPDFGCNKYKAKED